jgi:isocitrate dehydrogenase kinase/phosphatase
VTKRLQVLFDEPEWREIQRAARAERTTVAEWVRRALRAARRATSAKDVDAKLAAIRTAVRHELPTADIDQMNAEIARGYLGAPKA